MVHPTRWRTAPRPRTSPDAPPGTGVSRVGASRRPALYLASGRTGRMPVGGATGKQQQDCQVALGAALLMPGRRPGGRVRAGGRGGPPTVPSSTRSWRQLGIAHGRTGRRLRRRGPAVRRRTRCFSSPSPAPRRASAGCCTPRTATSAPTNASMVLRPPRARERLHSWDQAIARVAEGSAASCTTAPALVSVDAIAPKYSPGRHRRVDRQRQGVHDAAGRQTQDDTPAGRGGAGAHALAAVERAGPRGAPPARSSSTTATARSASASTLVHR